MIQLLFSIILILVVAGIIYKLIPYLTHIEMNMGERVPYDYVNFNTFLNEFNKYKDNPKIKYSGIDSIILYNQDEFKSTLYLHAEIVKIKGKCMIFYPLDYYKYKKWLKNEVKLHIGNHRHKGLWSQ